MKKSVLTNRAFLSVLLSGVIGTVVGCTSEPKKTEEVVAPAAPAAVAEVPVQTFKAEMKPTKGNKSAGEVILLADKNGLSMKVKMKNISTGVHGIHVHEKGDCSAPDATSAGGHFNPAAKPHGAPEVSESHTGDLGNVTADKDKKVEFSGVVKPESAFPKADWSQLEGKAVIVHANPDDLKSQPVGNAGARIACGVIKKVDESKAVGTTDSKTKKVKKAADSAAVKAKAAAAPAVKTKAAAPATK